MSNATIQAPTASAPRWWNVQRRLMPDYNLRATVFWWSVVLLGAAVVARSLWVLAPVPQSVWLQVALCTALAMAAGFVPVKVPGSTNSYTAGEIFIFVLVLSAGAEAAALAAAGEALIAAWRTSKRWTSRIGSPAMAAVSLYCAGSMLEALRNGLHDEGLHNDALLLCGAVLFAVAYFLINTSLVTLLPRLKRNEPLLTLGFLRSYGWLGVAYTGNAIVATFLYISYRHAGLAVLVAATPVIAVLLTTGHYHFKRKEAEEAARAAQASEAERARQHVHELLTSERRFHSAFTHASIGMALVSFTGNVRQANVALRSLLGLPADEACRLDFNGFVSRDGSTTLANLLATLEPGRKDSLAAELRCSHRDGREVWVSVHCSFFSEQDGSEPCLILQVQDISARQRAEAELHHHAFHDSLTGLPNRHRFNEYLARALATARDDPSRQFGVLFLDFDRFKLINDSMGHTVGDEFLTLVSRRIEQTVRTGDVVARLGGDEFAILAEDRGTPGFAVALAERLQQMLRRPFLIGGTEVLTTASIGITFSSFGYTTPEEVLRDADIAMYKAKAAGKAQHALFDSSLHEEVSNRLRLEGELRRALSEGALSIEYQPLFSLAGQDLLGFEALARWNHPQLGRISPAAFIPVAEESGSMLQLTDFVLATSCEQLRRWQQSDPAWADLKMHVNVAGNDIAAGNLVARIARCLVAARLQPQHLSIELTENILMERLESALGMLGELQSLGIGLSVDDFGTGYSSLSHLSTLPIDGLKIDRSFVQNLRPASKEAAVIQAIVLLGKLLGKEVIAEGIETPAQLEQLRRLGCDVGQGYHLARPMPPAAIEELLLSLRDDALASARACSEC